LKPDYMEAFFDRANAYREKGDYEHSIQDYDRAIYLEPNDADAFSMRCWTRAVFNKELESALADCDESLQLRPAHADTLTRRGFVHFRMAQYDRAIADCSASHERDPAVADPLYVRGLAERRKGDQAAGDADIAAAKALYQNIAKVYADYGAQP